MAVTRRMAAKKRAMSFKVVSDQLHPLAKGKLADDGLEPFEIFAFGETEDVVFAESSAIEGETITEPTQIVEKVHCLILWHGDPEIVAILHD
jgi:hypothetical protein